MFGTPDPWEEPDDLPDIHDWKATAVEIDAILQAQRDEFARRKRMEELATLQTMRNYVAEKTTIYQRREEQLRHMAEEYEQNRILKRQYDREERRRERFERYLTKEREHMLYEDERSYQLRDYHFEVAREQQEREDMFNEECDQCEIDRFWGIDMFEKNIREEEQRLRAFYEQRVYEANRRLVAMGTVKPLKRHEVSLVPLGKLPEDHKFDDDRVRRQAVIKKLKAEEIRSKLKIKLPTVYY
jgi:exonuclease VII large subunit